MNNAITLRNLTKRYGGRPVVESLTIDVPRGGGRVPRPERRR
jgi:ABC-type multidrug transport system ATPase subunit